VLGSLGKGYSAIMVGNLFHPLSAISQLIAEKDDEGKPRYVSKVYDLILDEGLPTERSLWQANWPMERIRKKKHDVGTYTFNKEYRNKVTVDGSPFPDEQAKHYERIEVINRKLIIATALDPSAKAGEGNDFRAAVTWGLDPEIMHFFCLHAWLKKKSIGEMFAAVYHQQEQYGSEAVFVEENMLKDFLHEAIANYAITAGRYIPWKPVQHNTNKEGRVIGTCAYLWEFGKMLFEKNHSDQNLLKEQFVYLLTPSVNDDGPDASEMAISGLQGGLVRAACAPVESTSDNYHAERKGSLLGMMKRRFGRRAA